MRRPTGFIPQQDKGYLILNVQLPDSASVERTRTDRWPGSRTIARKTPGVKHTVGVSGQSLILNANAPNLGSMYIMLEDFDKRRGPELTADAIAATLQDAATKEVRGADRVRVRRTAGRRPRHDRRLQAHRRGSRQPWPGRASARQRQDRRSAATRHRACTDLFNSSRANTPWLYLDIDRTKCMALGVQVSDVFNTLQVYLGSYYVNNFNEFGRTWQVNIQADQHFRSQVADIRQLQVRNNQGQMVRLGTMMDVRDTTAR